MWCSCSTCPSLSIQRWGPTVQTSLWWRLFHYCCFFWHLKVLLLQNNFKQQSITQRKITGGFAMMGSWLFIYQRCNLLIFLSPFMFKVSHTLKMCLTGLWRTAWRCWMFMLLFVSKFARRCPQRILPSHFCGKTVPLLPWREWHLYNLHSCFTRVFCEKTREMKSPLRGSNCSLPMQLYMFFIFYNISPSLCLTEIYHKPDCCYLSTYRQGGSWNRWVISSHLWKEN